MLNLSRLALSMLFSTVCLFGVGSSIGQDFPIKPIRLITPTGTGTSPDTLSRMIAPEMSKILGQPIVVENKPGAEQMIGYEYVAKQASADGYTMVLVSVGSLAALAATVESIRFDPLKDLRAVIGISESRGFLGSSSKFPWTTFNELVAFAKANPGKLNYGSTSAQQRLQNEAIVRQLGLGVVGVFYSTGAALTTAMASGEVQMGLLGEASINVLTSEGKFRVLAVTGSQRHSSTYRDVPTFAELGLPQIRSSSHSLSVPSRTPSHIIDKLYKAASRALQQPEVKARFANLRYDIIGASPEAAERNIAAEVTLYAEIIKKAGIKQQ